MGYFNPPFINKPVAKNAGGGTMKITTSPCYFHAIVISKLNKAKIKLYNDDSTTATNIFDSYQASIVLGTTLPFMRMCSSGLTITCASAVGMNVIYSDKI